MLYPLGVSAVPQVVRDCRREPEQERQRETEEQRRHEDLAAIAVVVRDQIASRVSNSWCLAPNDERSCREDGGMGRALSSGVPGRLDVAVSSLRFDLENAWVGRVELLGMLGAVEKWLDLAICRYQHDRHPARLVGVPRPVAILTPPHRETRCGDPSELARLQSGRTEHDPGSLARVLARGRRSTSRKPHRQAA